MRAPSIRSLTLLRLCLLCHRDCVGKKNSFFSVALCNYERRSIFRWELFHWTRILLNISETYTHCRCRCHRKKKLKHIQTHRTWEHTKFNSFMWREKFFGSRSTPESAILYSIHINHRRPCIECSHARITSHRICRLDKRDIRVRCPLSSYRKLYLRVWRRRRRRHHLQNAKNVSNAAPVAVILVDS